MEFFSDLKTRVKEFFTGEKKHVALIASLFIFLTFTALLVFIFYPRKKNAKIISERTLAVNEKLFPPAGPDVQSSYIKTRKTPEKWSESDVEKYANPPTETELSKLKDANDKMISDVLGAAP